MKFDITLNRKKYVVEIDNSKAKIIDKKQIAESQVDDITDIDVPDFDFSEKDMNTSLVSAPLPGIVITVSVKKGDSVVKSQILIVLESMKMENKMAAPIDEKIENIFVIVGSFVAKSQELVFLKMPDMAV
jgi:biotin carboxyl carrier protein